MNGPSARSDDEQSEGDESTFGKALSRLVQWADDVFLSEREVIGKEQLRELIGLIGGALEAFYQSNEPGKFPVSLGQLLDRADRAETLPAGKVCQIILECCKRT